MHPGTMSLQQSREKAKFPSADGHCGDSEPPLQGRRIKSLLWESVIEQR